MLVSIVRFQCARVRSEAQVNSTESTRRIETNKDEISLDLDEFGRFWTGFWDLGCDYKYVYMNELHGFLRRERMGNWRRGRGEASGRRHQANE
jgi:hypothetical protein